ncbi:MAG: YaaR family protein [Spirochaetia bacterium]|nr:YaaR family protein [Spirochaetia bacterium]
MQVRTTTDTEIRRRTTASKTERSTGAAGTKNSFLNILEEVLPADSEGADLHGLWEELPSIERDLLDHPSNQNFKRYRERIQKIGRETLRRNTKVAALKSAMRRKPGQPSPGDKVHSVLQVLDERLQKMALLMLSKNNSAIALLKSVEEIRGLLLDIRDDRIQP